MDCSEDGGIPLKEDVRVMAGDDGPFKFEDQASLLVGLVVRGTGYLEAVYSSSVRVDRLDATDAVAHLVKGSRQLPQLKAVLLDGLTLAGFNVVDIEALNRATDLPVLTVVDKVPDPEAIRSALEGRFPDWEERYRLISAPETHALDLPGGGTLTCHMVGMDVEEARELLRVTTLRGHLPEALRMAHLVASGLPRLVDVASWTEVR
ncbi:MAG: DUF99 family protein [Thermoplasmata archaeon]|nr:DUF99 family protein [Thermoplasmata archaeon]